MSELEEFHVLEIESVPTRISDPTFGVMIVNAKTDNDEIEVRMGIVRITEGASWSFQMLELHWEKVLMLGLEPELIGRPTSEHSM